MDSVGKEFTVSKELLLDRKLSNEALTVIIWLAMNERGYEGLDIVISSGVIAWDLCDRKSKRDIVAISESIDKGIFDLVERKFLREVGRFGDNRRFIVRESLVADRRFKLKLTPEEIRSIFSNDKNRFDPFAMLRIYLIVCASMSRILAMPKEIKSKFFFGKLNEIADVMFFWTPLTGKQRRDKIKVYLKELVHLGIFKVYKPVSQAYLKTVYGNISEIYYLPSSEEHLANLLSFLTTNKIKLKKSKSRNLEHELIFSTDDGMEFFGYNDPDYWDD